jgi:superfamily II DNA or RNA helicase
VKLHGYQKDAVKAAQGSLRRGKNPLVIMPTGTGKTVVFSELIRRTLGKRRGKRAIVLAHRSELLNQARDRLRSFGLTAEIEQAGQRASDTCQVVVASVQTVAHKKRRLDREAFDLVVVDEAHHVPASTYQRILKHYRCPVAGFTATADRLDEKSLGGVFNEVAYAMDMLTAIESGIIVPIIQRTVTVESIDVSRVKTIHGDLSSAELGKVLSKVKVLQGVAVPLLEHMGDRKTLAFAATVQHAHALANVLNRMRPGIARAVDGGDAPEYRARTLADFEAGKFQVLVNCQLFTEGFDMPSVSCVAMARPTQSRLLYAQAIGRATRLCSNKCDALILDFVGNSGKHSLVSSIDLLSRTEESPGVKSAAKKLIKDNPDINVHEALELARRLPIEVLKSYFISEIADDFLRMHDEYVKHAISGTNTPSKINKWRSEAILKGRIPAGAELHEAFIVGAQVYRALVKAKENVAFFKLHGVMPENDSGSNASWVVHRTSLKAGTLSAKIRDVYEAAGIDLLTAKRSGVKWKIELERRKSRAKDKRAISDDLLPAMYKMYQEGKSIRQIASVYNVSHYSVLSLFKRCGCSAYRGKHPVQLEGEQPWSDCTSQDRRPANVPG